MFDKFRILGLRKIGVVIRKIVDTSRKHRTIVSTSKTMREIRVKQEEKTGE